MVLQMRTSTSWSRIKSGGFGDALLVRVGSLWTCRSWVKGGCGGQADGTAGLPPQLPEVPVRSCTYASCQHAISGTSSNEKRPPIDQVEAALTSSARNLFSALPTLLDHQIVAAEHSGPNSLDVHDGQRVAFGQWGTPH